jgi:AcrR family transcriptional regulator
VQTSPDSVLDRLIDAAVQLFSRQGYRGTTTRQIARLANVNETSLFRHFARKQDLFWIALESRLRRLRVPRELQSRLEHNDSPELVLPLIVEFLVNTAIYQPELTRLLWVSLLELRPDAENFYRQRLEAILGVINNYVQHCVTRGALRDLDGHLAAVALVATISVHQEVHPILGSKKHSYTKAEDAVKAYSRFWLDALAPMLSASHLPPSPGAPHEG